jgi:DNA-binding transcriptional LysR family regulator
MDTRWFEDILVLIEEGTLTGAAERRAVTQPAFSRRIRAFETWLGQDVIDRTTNRVVIRDALKRSEPDIRAFLQRLREVQQALRHAETVIPRVTFATQHALTLSSFPDLIKTIEKMGVSLNYRLRSANRDDCISMIVRGDADALLCYETEDETPLPLDQSFRRTEWAQDRMIPVVGGQLRYTILDKHKLPPDVPVVTYPDTSYLGQTLLRKCPDWAAAQRTMRPICESAFSAGVREMVLQGIGIAWLPMSMVWQDREAGRIIDLSNILGNCELTICLYTKTDHLLTAHIHHLAEKNSTR